MCFVTQALPQFCQHALQQCLRGEQLIEVNLEGTVLFKLSKVPACSVATLALPSRRSQSLARHRRHSRDSAPGIRIGGSLHCLQAPLQRFIPVAMEKRHVPRVAIVVCDLTHFPLMGQLLGNSQLPLGLANGSSEFEFSLCKTRLAMCISGFSLGLLVLRSEPVSNECARKTV